MRWTIGLERLKVSRTVPHRVAAATAVVVVVAAAVVADEIAPEQ